MWQGTSSVAAWRCARFRARVRESTTRSSSGSWRRCPSRTPAPENMPPKSTTSAACETTRGYLHDCMVTGTHRNGIRVLVVDDQASIRLPLCDDLGEAGFAVSAAANVADALSVARAQQPQVVVLDLLLGTESGLDVARTLRGEPGDNQPLIIALSG